MAKRKKSRAVVARSAGAAGKNNPGSVAAWVAEECVLEHGALMPADFAHKHFCEWRKEKGLPPLSRGMFAERMRRIPKVERVQTLKLGGRSFAWCGLTQKSDVTPRAARPDVRLAKPKTKCVKRREVWHGVCELGTGLGNIFRTPDMARTCLRGPHSVVVEVLVEYWVPGSLGKT